MGIISRPGSLILLIFLENVFLKASITVAKLMAVLLCIVGIVCTIQPRTDISTVGGDPTPHFQSFTSRNIYSANVSATGPKIQYNLSHEHEQFPLPKRDNKSLNDPVIGFISVTVNVFLTVTILIYQRHKLTSHVDSSTIVFWAWIIGVPVSGLVTFIFEYGKWHVDWNLKCILCVTGHGISAGFLNVFVTIANNKTSSLVVQLASSLQLVIMLIGQYTVLINTNPGHYNILEVVGVLTIVVGSCLVPLYSIITKTSSIQ